MPRKTADTLATDVTISSEELEAAVATLSATLDAAARDAEPVPFLTYRNKMILQTSLRLRHNKRWLRY